MGDLVLKGATSGQITIAPTAVAGTNTLTAPAVTGNLITSADSGTIVQAMIQNGNSSTPLPGIGGTGPAFSAYMSSSQTLSTNTWTKLNFQSKEFDTNNNFDSSTNYRFTPTVAGYYQISGGLAINATPCGINCSIYKNGSSYKVIVQMSGNTLNAAYGSALVYLNGSTDYVELYGYVTSGQALAPYSASTYFQAALVRAA